MKALLFLTCYLDVTDGNVSQPKQTMMNLPLLPSCRKQKIKEPRSAMIHLSIFYCPGQMTQL